MVSSTVHSWLWPMRVAFAPGPSTPLLEQVAGALLDRFRLKGHCVQAVPDDETDILLTTAHFGRPLSWREALLFQARRKFGLSRSPTVFTLLQARPQQWADLLAHLEWALAKHPPDPADFDFPGLAPMAFRTLAEQGRRGGAILAAQRLLQSQAMCLKLLLVVGDDDYAQYAHHFDLVGACPRTPANSEAFYDDLVLRMVTAVCARPIDKASVLTPPVTTETWQDLLAPAAMRAASLEFGRRNFFTEMVKIAELIHVPALADAVADQYSEGCFATWEPQLDALIATTTGSARPVDKSNITDDDLAVVVGVQPGGQGVQVRHVEGKRNDPPSSEAFEMVDMDDVLPKVSLQERAVPVIRSKLHGHRGVATFDPNLVEYAPMDAVYFHYPVTCGTYAQAQGIKNAFARSQALQNPADSRQVVFTLLPTHGVFIVEKWSPTKAAFQTIWEYMDAGYLRIEARVPQGPEPYTPQIT